MKTPRSVWRDYRAKRADNTALTKGEAQRKKERKKLLSAPGTIRKKIAERGNDLLTQLRNLAASGSLSGVLTAAGAVVGGTAVVGAVAVAGAALVDEAFEQLGVSVGPFGNEDEVATEAAELAQTQADTAIYQAMAAADQAREAVEASATVEARLDDSFDELRTELFTELETFQSDLSTLGGQVDVLTARMDDPEPEARLRAVEALAATALKTAEAIEIPDTTGIAANRETLASVQNELAIARAVIDQVPSLRTAVESAEGIAVLARAEAGTAGDSLDAVRAEVAEQQQNLGAADSATVAALAQAEEAFLLAQQNENRAAQAVAQTAALESEIDTLTDEVAASEATLIMVQATADAAVKQEDLAVLAAQADAAQAQADQTAMELEVAQAAVTALEADQTATEAELAQAQADVVAAQTAADTAQLAANGAQVAADGAEAAAQTAQAAADTAQAAADAAQTTADQPDAIFAGPGSRLTIPAHGWHRGFTPITIQESGRYRVEIIAEYASGSGTALFQGVLIDNETSPTFLVQHNNYALFVPFAFNASFVIDLTVGQTVDQALSHNSNGTTGWTSMLVSAERIGP